MEWAPSTPIRDNAMAYHVYGDIPYSKQEWKNSFQEQIDNDDYLKLLDIINSLPRGDLGTL